MRKEGKKKVWETGVRAKQKKGGGFLVGREESRTRASEARGRGGKLDPEKNAISRRRQKGKTVQKKEKKKEHNLGV